MTNHPLSEYFRLPPYDHQKRIWEESRDLEGYAAFWEMGTGKSCLIIGTAAYLYLENKIDGMLILAPNSVHTNWTSDEIPIHMPDVIANDMRVMTWYSEKGGQVGTKENLKGLLAHDGLAILSMSYNSLMTQDGAKAAKQFLQKRRCMYVLDESGRIKNPGAKRTKRVIASSSYAPYRRILTGTPVDNSPFDIFTGIKFIRPDIWSDMGLRTFALFKHRFGIWERRMNSSQGRQFEVLTRYRNLDLLKSIVDKVGSRLLKVDVLDLPPKLYLKRYFDLDPEQARVYRDLHKSYKAWLKDGSSVTADLALTRMLRMSQITSGYVGSDDDTLVPLGTNVRLKTLEDVLEDVTGPVIIWAKYSPDIDAIRALLGEKEAVYFDGRTSTEDRADAKKRFQKDGSARFFVGKPSAAGEGLTLHRAKTVIYYNNTFSFRERVQSEDRAHRAGMSDGAVTYIDLLARGTMDGYILDALRNKRVVAATITGDQLPTWA